MGHIGYESWKSPAESGNAGTSQGPLVMGRRKITTADFSLCWGYHLVTLMRPYEHTDL